MEERYRRYTNNGEYDLVSDLLNLLFGFVRTFRESTQNPSKSDSQSSIFAMKIRYPPLILM